MTTETTTKTLTDDDGDYIVLCYDDATHVVITAETRDGSGSVTAGPFDVADLIAAICEVAGETDDKPEPTPSKSPTAEDFAKEQFARHEDGRIAVRVLGYRASGRPWCVVSAGYSAWYSDADMAAGGGWSIVTPAPTTPREALALAVSLAYEVEGDTMPDQNGYMMVRKDGRIVVRPDDSPVGLPARGATHRRLLLDPPAPVTPAWHDARIMEATCRGRVGQWARTATDGLWVSLDGESREAYTPDLTDVTVVVPEEVEA